MSEEHPFLTLRDAARWLGIDHRTIREARDAGEFPVYQLGRRWQRVSREDLLAWVHAKRCRIKPQPHASS